MFKSFRRPDIERDQHGRPRPCREWCAPEYQGGPPVIGNPTPANPPKYPQSGCMAHRKNPPAPCMLIMNKKTGKVIRPAYFAHPDERDASGRIIVRGDPEWAEVPGQKQTEEAQKLAEEGQKLAEAAVKSVAQLWREGAYASAAPALAAAAASAKAPRPPIKSKKVQGVFKAPDDKIVIAPAVGFPPGYFNKKEGTLFPDLEKSQPWGDIVYDEEHPRPHSSLIRRRTARARALNRVRTRVARGRSLPRASSAKIEGKAASQ